MSAPIPQEFGGSWDAFVREWCCGVSLGYSQADISRALLALRQLWPQEVKRRISEPNRGLSVAAAIVEAGLLLDAGRTAVGFDNVLRRLSTGERSAYSEFVLGAALRRLNFPFRFEPPLEGKVLDAKTDVAGEPVFFEVVAPELSIATAQDNRIVNLLTETVRAAVANCRVEIEVRVSLTEDSIADIGVAIQKAAASVWVTFKDAARIRRIDFGQPLLPLFDGDGAQVIVGGEESTQGKSTTVVARFESSDTRAKRVFNEEYHQFSATVANVLVVNVCAISNGMVAWPFQIKRLLQPSRNRKVGAVLFFEQGSIGPPEAIRRRWKILVNRNAHVEVPEQLLDGIDSLDESEAYGLPRPTRIAA